ncbi:hypothetical protein BN140_1319 [Methanoculleus bourgensis MS2]|uniref:Uncharacterized protein n=2 Tax=Methanoculleus bourgensis TaxID=83986 RepID=I7LJQ5_METBM|nr:hypothetical protein BN140_1319 [Methanoculleus bourgensis MS2]
MRMSKHHANALIALGIAICAGFLISTPAVADPGHGLAAVESGELLQLSPGDLLAAENGTEPSGVPEPPGGEETTDLPPGADEELVMPAIQNGSETSASPVLPDDAPPEWTGHYDDERLTGLINTAGISLMKLSMEHAHALYLQDAGAASVAADDLHALSTRLLGEVQSFQVSPGQQPTKDEFIRSLAAYSAASRELLDTPESAPTAFRELVEASEGLEAVSQQTSASMRGSATATTLAAAPAVQAGAMPVQVMPSPEILSLQERHTYDDPSGENMVSLLAESTRTATAYQEAPVNASAMKVEAGEGRMFLLAVVKSTNLGHKGNSDLYSIETPGRSAFTLEYQGTTFAPLDVPAFTSLGESFDQKTLERYESLKGYLYFDVPASLNVSGATLRADLGYAGTPAWNLRKIAEEEAGEPGAA